MFKQCGLTTVAKREQEVKKLEKAYQANRAPRETRIQEYFRNKHQEELQMKKKFDLFIDHHHAFLKEEEQRRKEALQRNMA